MLKIEDIQKSVDKANTAGKFTVISTDADGKGHNYILLKNKRGVKTMIRLNVLADQKYVIKEKEVKKKDIRDVIKNNHHLNFNILSPISSYNDPVYVSCKSCGSIHFYQHAYKLHKKPKCRCCNATSGEKIVFNFLKENEIVHIVQYPLFIKGNCYWVDFMIVDNKGRPCCGIEFDGRWHFDDTPWENTYSNETDLVYAQKRDATKESWFEERRIPLIRINYFDFCTNSKLDEEKVKRFLKEELERRGLCKFKK